MNVKRDLLTGQYAKTIKQIVLESMLRICPAMTTEKEFEEYKRSVLLLEPDWQILEWSFGHNHEHKTKEPDGTTNYAIYSIRRIADDKVFTIGDSIICPPSSETGGLIRIEIGRDNNAYLSTSTIFREPMTSVINCNQPKSENYNDEERFFDTIEKLNVEDILRLFENSPEITRDSLRELVKQKLNIKNQ